MASLHAFHYLHAYWYGDKFCYCLLLYKLFYIGFIDLYHGYCLSFFDSYKLDDILRLWRDGKADTARLPKLAKPWQNLANIGGGIILYRLAETPIFCHKT